MGSGNDNKAAPEGRNIIVLVPPPCG